MYKHVTYVLYARTRALGEGGEIGNLLLVLELTLRRLAIGGFPSSVKVKFFGVSFMRFILLKIESLPIYARSCKEPVILAGIDVCLFSIGLV